MVRQTKQRVEPFISEKQVGALSELTYYNILQGNLIEVVTNSLMPPYFISIQETLVIWQKYFLQT